MRHNVHRKIFFISSLFLTFCLPLFQKVIPAIIVVMMANWLISGIYLTTIPKLLKDKWRILTLSFASLYLLYLSGMLYSTNYIYGLSDLGVKFSLFIFPVIFATSYFPLFSKKETGIILRVFAAGCIAGSLMLIGRAFYHSIFLHQPGVFYYDSLSWIFHPGYYSMYIAFAMSNILYFLLIRQSVKGFLKVAGHILILLFFTLMIVLLSSKAGLLIWISVICFYAILLLFKYKRWLTSVTFVAVAFTAFILFLLTFPKAASRVSQAKQDIASADSIAKSGRSTGDRVLIWQSSKEIVKQNFLFGVGTGDVRDKLMEEYKRKDVLTVLKHYLNAHNQYLQTLIALGISGLLLLMAMILMPAIFSVKRENYIYFAFLFIVGISMFFESMLERQQGVVFYVFFNTFLFAGAVVDTG